MAFRTAAGALAWPERKLGLQRLSALWALLLTAAVTAMVGSFYLNRTVEPRYTDRLLTNYFAYYQDLIAAGLFLLLLLAMTLMRSPGAAKERRWVPGRSFVPLLSLAVFIGCYAGARLLFQGYGLSIDEHMADFDAKILRAGYLFAPVAPEWRAYVNALEPTFLFTTSDGSLWSSSYLPGNAALRALVSFAGDADLTSPLLAAASLMLLFGVARKLQPDHRGFGIVAVLLLASSSQFLITAMTPYAMTAHLALNLAWLWCALDDRRWSRVAAVAISFLACGLHQMIFHPLFVAPFLPWLWLTGKRWPAVVYAVAVAAFALFWINYWTIALAVTAPGATIAGVLHVPLFDRIEALVDAAMRPIARVMTADNLLRLVTWQNPILWPLVAAALLSLRRLPSIAWPLFGGILLTFAAMLLLMPQQGHGWGYRYLHGLLGNFALLGAFGWGRISQSSAERTTRLIPWLGASLALALFLMLPLRIAQVHEFAAGYLEANRRIDALPADIVVIDQRGRWFANDLVRNDPFLRDRPIRLLANRLNLSTTAPLCRSKAIREIDHGSPELAPVRAIGSRESGRPSAFWLCRGR